MWIEYYKKFNKFIYLKLQLKMIEYNIIVHVLFHYVLLIFNHTQESNQSFLITSKK